MTYEKNYHQFVNSEDILMTVKPLSFLLSTIFTKYSTNKLFHLLQDKMSAIVHPTEMHCNCLSIWKN